MQGAVVAVVDVPGGDSWVTVADVLPRAHLSLIHSRETSPTCRCILSQDTGVDLLLNEKGDKVDEVGSDRVAPDADCEVDEHVEEADSSCPL